jgi:hypothetical protein
MGEKRHNAMFRREEWPKAMLIDAAPPAALGLRAKVTNFGVACEAGASSKGGPWEEER